MKTNSALRLQIYSPTSKSNSPLPFTRFKFKRPSPISYSRVTTVVISRQILQLCYRKISSSYGYVTMDKRPLNILQVLSPESDDDEEQYCQENPRRELPLAHHHHVSNSSGSGGYSNSRFIIVGAISMGLVLFLMGADDHQKAMALGPQGPSMEEFWDNVRRYALYALTVSTGAIYTIFQPILELLKNPISAILILLIIGGSIYIVSQVLSAMVGVSDFTYSYAY